MEESKYEIVKFVDSGFELEVNVSPSEDTVWLTQEQIGLLFNTARSSITYHIKNVFCNSELDEKTSVKFFDISQNHRPSKYYNLDVILAVGYRVNSQRGIYFRRWANNVLKQYLMKGYAIDSTRVLVTPENYLNLVNVVNRIDSKQTNLENRIENLEQSHPEIINKLFFKGQLWDATSLIEDLILKAGKSITLIDNYIDKKTLDLMTKRKAGVKLSIFTSSKGKKLTQKEISDFNSQYGPLEVKTTEEFHDRFMILDEKVLYHIGASIKDAGKKAFEISLIEDNEHIKAILGKL